MYSIIVKFVNEAGQELDPIYARGDTNNPVSIEKDEIKELKFYADGINYSLPAKVRLIVTGATKENWARNADFSEGTLTISGATADVTIIVKVSTIAQALTAGPFISPAKTPLDARVLIRKNQMPFVKDEDQPAKYFALCFDDNKFYIYDKSLSLDSTIGKFRPLEDYLNIRTEYTIDGGEIK